MRLIATLLLCLTGLLPALARAADDDDVPPPSHKRIEWDTHEDKERGYKIQFPGDWEERKPPSEHVVAMFVAPPARDSRSADTVTVSFNQAAAKQDLDQVLAGVEKAARKNFKDFKLISKGSASLDGRAARKLVHLASAENGITVEVITVFTALDDGRIFSITIAADPKRHERLQPTIKTLLDSFKVFDPK